MDAVERYSQIVRAIIEEYALLRPAMGEIVIEKIFDERAGHYELMHTGWNGLDRVHGSVIHVDIRGDKVFIEQDGTEEGIANSLVRAGIPKDRIVLAFKSPDIRPYTDFAAA